MRNSNQTITKASNQIANNQIKSIAKFIKNSSNGEFMLDSRAELLLNYICEICGSGYKIVTIKQMLSVFPEWYMVEQEELSHIIKTLVNTVHIVIFVK